jgi:hypothetical protein
VRFDIDLQLLGQGLHDLVLSHPSPLGGRNFTAFRGSIEIRTPDGLQSVHVGLRSGQSLSLTQLNLQPGRATPVRVSLVYPADSTPGHLLSVVPVTQLAQLQDQERRQEMARLNRSVVPFPEAPPALEEGGAPLNKPKPPLVRPTRPRGGPLTPPPQVLRSPSLPTWLKPPPNLPSLPPRSQPAGGLTDAYREALEAQQQMLRQWKDMP